MPGEPFILNFAPTGIVARKGVDDEVPMEPARIVDEVLEAAADGVTMAHLHVRNAAGEPTLRPECYAELVEEIRRQEAELVICLSLSGRRGADIADRLAPLKLTGAAKPDMASLTPTSLNFAREPSINDPIDVMELAATMASSGVVPELEIFDLGMANAVRYLEGKGLVQPPYYANLMLGNPFGAQANPLSLGALVAALPPGCLWSAGGIGRHQPAAHFLALGGGGGVRTGLEDNFFSDLARMRRATNKEKLAEARQAAAMLEREVMTPAEFRRRMGLGGGHGEYGRAAAGGGEEAGP